MLNIKDFYSASPVKGRFENLGDIITGFSDLVFYIAGALTFIWFVWAVFEYLLAGGDKQKLASARNRITWALVGLLVVAMSYGVAKFAEEIIKPRGGTPLL